MAKTPNYGLELPLQTDYYDIDLFNDNNTIVDTALAAKAAKTVTYTAEITTENWSSYTLGYVKTVEITGLKDSGHVFATIDLSTATSADTATAMLEAFGTVTAIQVSNGSITLVCVEETPSTAFTLRLEVAE